jgi:LmbE family N-acetylglucosaminyl deacetylase
VLLLFAPRLHAQERGAIALGQSVLGLGVNTRVLMIGAHPDDEDTFLIAWLSRGRHVETAYLSLTRGDGGQNIIGNELGEALGVIRTEELLAARRVDGALQYFTRAYDFGFSKNVEDTYRHWPKDSILGDVVRVVRDFRPHVIVAVFSGTPRDGHGQHQVAGILARDAYDVAADTMRFPVAHYGAPWSPLKFYRAARSNAQGASVGVDVGEYAPLLGESYGEIAGRSRSQHKSQGFGALQRKGTVMDYVRREGTRVNEAAAGDAERSMFDGIDTTWARFRPVAADIARRASLDSLPAAFLAARAAFDPLAPEKLVPPLTRAAALIAAVCPVFGGNPCAEVQSGRRAASDVEADYYVSLRIAQLRVWQALQLATGVAIEATAPREAVAVGSSVPVAITVYNRGRDSLTLSNPVAVGSLQSVTRGRALAPGGTVRDSIEIAVDELSRPWWLTAGRAGGTFVAPGSAVPENRRPDLPAVYYLASVAGTPLGLEAPVVFRFADDVEGEIQRQVAGVPAVAVSLDARLQYAPANTPLDLEARVHLRSADTRARDVRVSLRLPAGLRADSAVRRVRLDGYDAQRTVSFRIRGRLAAGSHTISALAASDGVSFGSGYQLVDYDHIRRQRVYRPAATTLSVVDVRVPAGLRVAYVTGVSDNVAPTLVQLGVPVTIIAAGDVARADLTRFTTVVIGPRAYEAHPELATSNARLLEWARAGGTLVVQYGQYEMTRPGIMPYPVELSRPADRVTVEQAPVTIVAPDARELRVPNRIAESDFADWVQERALYMPRSFDPRYRPLLAMNDPGEPSNRAAILVAPVGKGTYIYTTLSFFRQLPAGNPGGARLFVNLLSAGLSAPGPTR